MYWVCESPFDESKQFKPHEKEEEEGVVEEETFHKKETLMKNFLNHVNQILCNSLNF